METSDAVVVIDVVAALVIFVVAPVVVGILLLVHGRRVRRKAVAAQAEWDLRGGKLGLPPPRVTPASGTALQVAGGIFLLVAVLALLQQVFSNGT